MKKKHVYFIFILIFLGVVIFQQNYLSYKLSSYVSRKAEQELGAIPLAKKQEKKIKAIAHKMGVVEPIVIRKMNHKALAAFGYYNAIAHFPSLFGFIPVRTEPFLFISEGFFEDLSSEEQLFLIGHEMVHIRERHTRYLNLVYYLLFLGLLLFWWFSKRYFRSPALIVVHRILLCIFLVAPNLICLAYRRRIEREADYTSMKILNSYDGGIKLIERWRREFKMPADNPHFGLFSDHPSHFERKICCLEFKNKAKTKHETHKKP